MKDLQAILGQAAENLEGLGFTKTSSFVDVENRDNSRAEINFEAVEGKARTFSGYLEEKSSHYPNVNISFIVISGKEYKILISPQPHMMKHEPDRKSALNNGINRLIKDIENYRMRHP